MRLRAVSRFFAPLITASALLFVAGDASAFCRTTTCDKSKGDSNCETNDVGCIKSGVPLHWDKLPITYRFYIGGSDKLEPMSTIRAKVRAAFQTWENVQCGSRGRTSVRFEEGADVRTNKKIGQYEGAENFGIYFRDDDWPHNDSDDSLALTNQHFGLKTGTILYADIEINTANYAFAVDDSNKDDIDFQSVMTHEAGHYLGLAHSPDENSIMVAHYCESDNRCHTGSTDAARGLSPDDEKGVCTLYPPGGISNDSAVGSTAGCATSPLHEMSAFAVGVGMLVVGLALRRRRAHHRA